MELSIKNANPGDYFDLTVSKNMHYNMLQPDKVSIPYIIDANEEIIAKPYLISSGLGEEKTVRYVFTDYVIGKENIKISAKEINFSVDVYGVPNSGDQTFTAKIENSSIPQSETQTQVTQKELAEKDDLNLKAAFDYTNDTNGKYTQVIYINPKGNNINNTKLSIKPYYDSKFPKTNYVTANISQESTNIKIYKYTGEKLPDAVIIEKDNLTDVTGHFKDKINIKDGFAQIDFGSLDGSEKYVVIVESEMAFPKENRKGTYLVQIAKLSDGVNFISEYDGIAVQTSGAGGSGQSIGSNEAELTVPNYPESKGKFIINKTDNKNKALGGAEFTLTRTKPSNLVLPTQKSDEKTGKIFFKDLEPGEYKLEETQAPKGHKKSEETWTVKVDKDGKTTISPDNKESSNERKEASAENSGIINKALSIFQPKENNGFLLKPKYEISNPQAIESGGYRLSQTLDATSDPKVYEVSAKIEKISDDLEMVIVFEETPGGSWRVGDDKFYKDRINKIIDELSVKNPKAIFSVIGVNDAMHKYVDRKTAVQAKNTLANAKFKTKITRKALPNAFEEASNIFGQSNARQKVLVHISGFSYYPAYDTKDKILSRSQKAFNNMKALGVKTNQFIEVNPTNSSHYKDATKSDYPWYAYFENISTAFNTGIYNVSDLKNEFAKLSKDKNYKYEDKLLGMLSKYNQDIKLNFSPDENFTIIEPIQNLKLDGSEETLSQFPDILTFTYKVKINDLLKNNNQVPINKLAYIKYKDIIYNFPIPTLTIPRLTLEFTKEWKNTEDSEKSEITVVLKAKTEQGVEISNLSNLGINQNSIKVSADTSWKGSFTNLPQFTKDGERIRYYIEETGIANQKSDFEVKYYYMYDGTSVKIENTKIPSITVPNKPSRGKFEILKVDADNKEIKLDGVEFTLTKLGEDGQKLTGDENIKRQTTKDGGKAVFSDLSDGKYLLEETQAKNGYQKTFEPINIVVEQAKVYKLGKPENSEGGSPDTLKTSSSTNNFANISAKIINVDEKNKTFTYRIYANDWTKKDPKNAIYFSSDFHNPTVNINASQSGVEITDIKIKKAPINYAKSDSYFPKKMEDLNMTYFSEYSPEPKITRETSKARIEFNIPITQYFKEKLLGDGSVAIIDVTASYTGNSINISSSFEYQPPKNPSNKEIAKVENSYTAKITSQDEKTEIESTKALEITNKREPLEFIKVEAVSNKKLSGVEFELRGPDSFVKKYHSDNDGLVKIDPSNLQAGDYELHETKPLENYKKPENSKVAGFTIDVNGLATSVSPENKTISNTLLGKTKIKVDKTDGSSNKLSGVEFELLDQQGNKLDSKKTENGEITFDKLPFGEYYLKEVKTLDGYILDSQPRKILIGKDFKIPENVTGSDVSAKVTASGTTMEVIGASSTQTMIKPNQLGQIVIRNTFNFGPDIKAGDHFTVKYSDNVNVGGLSPNNSINLDIVGTAGVLAKGKWDENTHAITYTFTEYIDNYRVTEAKTSTFLYIDLYKVKDTSDQTISQTINNVESLKKTLRVNYDDYVGSDDDRTTSMSSAILKMDEENGTYQHIVYINPLGYRRNGTYKTSQIFYNAAFNGNYSSVIVNQDTDIKLYYVPNEVKLPKSLAIDDAVLKQLTLVNNYKRINYYSGKVELSFNKYLPIEGYSYVMVVNGKYNKDSKLPINPSVELNNTWSVFNYRDYYGYDYYNNYRSSITYQAYVERHENTSEADGVITVPMANFPNKIEFTKIALELDKNGQNSSATAKKTPLNGVRFELRKAETKDGEYIKVTDSERTSAGEKEKTGKISYEKLSPGFYKLYETKALAGYKTPTEAVASFEVNKNGEIVNVTPENREIINTKSEADIEFVKIDGRTKDKIGSRTGGVPNYLEAEFTLYKWNDSSQETDKYETYKIRVKESESADEIEKDYVVKSNTTDGKFKFEKLPDGKYAIKETKGANGYLKPEDYIVEFEVKDGKVQEELNFKKPFGETKNSTNYIYNYKGEYPSSGGKGSLIFTLVGLGFMTTAYILGRKRRKSLRGRR